MRNNSLLLGASTSEQQPATTYSEGSRETNGAPHRHPSALLRVSRLASISSEDSIAVGDVQALGTGPPEVGGAKSNGGHEHKVVSSSSGRRGSDDFVMVGDSGGQSLEVGAAGAASSAHVQTATTAESAMVTMETTSSEVGKPVPEASESKIENPAEGDGSSMPVGSPRRKKNLPDTLDRIRTTLYGSGQRLPATGGKRRSHTVLSRHTSLRVPPSRDESVHSLIRSQKLSGSISMFQLHADMTTEMTESLPPSKWVQSTYVVVGLV